MRSFRSTALMDAAISARWAGSRSARPLKRSIYWGRDASGEQTRF
eukprot:gene46468-46777_t